MGIDRPIDGAHAAFVRIDRAIGAVSSMPSRASARLRPGIFAFEMRRYVLFGNAHAKEIG